MASSTTARGPGGPLGRERQQRHPERNLGGLLGAMALRTALPLIWTGASVKSRASSAFAFHAEQHFRYSSKQEPTPIPGARSHSREKEKARLGGPQSPRSCRRRC